MPVLNLLRTSTFRLMAVYLVLFALSAGAILGYVYWNTAVLLERQGDETIRAETSGLAEQYRQGGLNRLLTTLRARATTPSNNVYLLTNFKGDRLVGNLDGLPPGVDAPTGWTEFPYAVLTPQGKVAHIARAQYFTLRGGYRLVVGRDVQERRRFASVIRQALIWALGFTIALGICGGVFLSRTFLRRVESINDTSRAIMAGDFSERMMVSGTGDELDRLSTSLNDMLEQIERLMTGMREVTDNVAHDLKTPLTRLRARVEDALRGGSKKEYKAALELTIEEADGLLKIFNALLAIARAEAGEARTRLKSTDVSALVHDLAELYGPISEEHGGAVVTEIQDGLLVRADRQLLSQALANLIDNALKYAPSGTGRSKFKITLSARRDADWHIVSVADNGPGIKSQDRDRVIERFVRLDDARSEPGSGLGLSLAAGIAKLHGGSLILEDNAPGLRVDMRLPPYDATLARATKT